MQSRAKFNPFTHYTPSVSKYLVVCFKEASQARGAQMGAVDNQREGVGE